MQNPYYTQSAAIRKIVNEQLPNGLETTADMLLEYMSKSNDEQLMDNGSVYESIQEIRKNRNGVNLPHSLRRSIWLTKDEEGNKLHSGSLKRINNSGQSCLA